ncbi:hypothetical protein SEUCBS140593_007970 [Sporothrix eucalyptigena]|uniref:Rhamnogalacturonase A/B/Epimerase-like pectate lyase domain-containing protein n=1 Tax=Sporothrix eucalyptigena TaxID=1812306 RepID=A0ABP0CJK3_9PEZI
MTELFRSILVLVWAMSLACFSFGLHLGPRPLSQQRSPGAAVLHPSLPAWKLNARGTAIPLRLLNATDTDILQAQAIVDQALAEASILNAARVAHPRRNNYNASPYTTLTKKSSFGSPPSPPPPLLQITEQIAAAAALVAELDAVNSNATRYVAQKKRGAPFWMESIARIGTSPWSTIPDFQVFRNVKDFGAKGDGVTATSWPTIVAAKRFVGMGVLATDQYVPNGGNGVDGNAKEWYIDTASFYRQIRNFRIDIRQASQSAQICGIHYQVAQATSLEFIELISTSIKDNAKTTQQGIFAENGSGGQMADITFTGGLIGLFGGNQQFTAQRLTFNGCATAVQLNWDWGWEPGTGTTGITLDNVAFSGVKGRVVDTDGKEYVQGSPSSVDTWVLGPVFFTPPSRDVSLGYSFPTPRDNDLVGDAINGDGVSDDTLNLQALLDVYGNADHVIFIDAGVYLLSDTITVPAGARIVGEAWSQLAATGPKFSDASKPNIMLRIGSPSSKGSVEIQDLLFTTKGATPGAILVEWNLLADGKGTAGMWVHTSAQIATSALVAQQAPALRQKNARHPSPVPTMVVRLTQVSVYNARGFLIESTAPTWLYGTASEHSVLYQYNFNAAKNIFAGMIQTESPYYQPNPAPPAPFQSAVGALAGDPDYASCTSGKAGCDESWAVIIRDSENIHIAGAGLYSWYSNYDEACAKDNLAVNTHPYWSQVTVFYPIQNKPNPCRENVSSLQWHITQADYTYYPAQGKRSDWPGYVDDSHIFYVTVINASPDDFILTSTHSYQMPTFNFSTVAAGTSRQNTMTYEHSGTKSFVDDEGEAYYSIGNTKQTTFQVQARTDVTQNEVHPMVTRYVFDALATKDVSEGSSVEVIDRKGQRAANLVIAGSQKYGYWTSANPPVGWMGAILDIIGDRKLKHVCLLGSHDAGMSSIHGSTSELVIVRLSNDFNTDEGYRGLNGTEWNHVFDIFAKLDHLCGGIQGDLTDRTINDYIGDGQPCVLVVSDGGPVRPETGIYGVNQFPNNDHWSDTMSVDTMASDQISYMKANRNVVANNDKEKFFITQWIMTVEGFLNNAIGGNLQFGIDDLAIRSAYDAVFWKAWNAFTPTMYPSVILMDFIGAVQIDSTEQLNMSFASREAVALVMAVNLAVASMNCYVGGGSIY